MITKRQLQVSTYVHNLYIKKNALLIFISSYTLLAAIILPSTFKILGLAHTTCNLKLLLLTLFPPIPLPAIIIIGKLMHVPELKPKLTNQLYI